MVAGLGKVDFFLFDGFVPDGPVGSTHVQNLSTCRIGFPCPVCPSDKEGGVVVAELGMVDFCSMDQ